MESRVFNSENNSDNNWNYNPFWGFFDGNLSYDHGKTEVWLEFDLG